MFIYKQIAQLSLSARRAWIEICCPCRSRWVLVAVALRKESVDRNIPSHWITSRTGVALRKESVDRNKMSKIAGMYEVGSLSARRAWIEITYIYFGGAQKKSLSARRAWIEISLLKASKTGASGRSPQGERG